MINPTKTTAEDKRTLTMVKKQIFGGRYVFVFVSDFEVFMNRIQKQDANH